jgi:hypothetical protein
MSNHSDVSTASEFFTGDERASPLDRGELKPPA